MKKIIFTPLVILLITVIIKLAITFINPHFQLQLDKLFDKDIVIFSYTISSIIFSIVFTNISTYNYEIVKNYKLMNVLYNNIKNEKNNLLTSFIINSIIVFCFYLINSIQILNEINRILSQAIPLISISYSIYYIMSLSSIFTSKKEIIDRIHEEEQMIKSSHIK